MSGGQRRRVDIARALINRPKLLFLDEPTTGLDPKTRLQVWEIIHNLRKETGLTVFLTTHYMEETVDCDNVVIIDSGKIVANDSPHNLKKDYSSNSLVWYTEENSENDNLLKTDNLDFERVGDAYKIKIKNSRQALEITNKHTEIVDFEIIKGNMDDVYLNDKTAIIFSMMTQIIILGLYLLFLKQNYVDSMASMLDGFNIKTEDNLINALVNSWLVSGVIGTSVVTVAMNSLSVLISD